MENWEQYTEVLVATIDYSNKINNKWTWTDDKAVDDAERNFLTSIHDYTTKIYETENADLYPKMREIAQRVIKYYPNEMESYTFVAISYFFENEIDKSINTLLEAYNINPKDADILNNLAFVYAEKGDKAKAIKYYEMVLKYGSKDEISNAKKKIAELSEN